MSNLETPREDRESPSLFLFQKKETKTKTRQKKKSKNFLKVVRKGGIRMMEILGSSMENRSPS